LENQARTKSSFDLIYLEPRIRLELLSSPTDLCNSFFNMKFKKKLVNAL
jgi:hypothetical protein